MTLEAAARILRSITFGWPLKAWGLWLQVEPRPTDGMLMATIHAQVPHRDTGVPNLSFTRIVLQELELVCARDDAALAASLVERVRMAVRNWLTHELDESLLVSGRRVFDPHPAPRLPPASAQWRGAEVRPIDDHALRGRAEAVGRAFAAVRRARDCGGGGVELVVDRPGPGVSWHLEVEPWAAEAAVETILIRRGEDPCAAAARLLAAEGRIGQPFTR
jgi:hypothetical protein